MVGNNCVGAVTRLCNPVDKDLNTGKRCLTIHRSKTISLTYDPLLIVVVSFGRVPSSFSFSVLVSFLTRMSTVVKTPGRKRCGIPCFLSWTGKRHTKDTCVFVGSGTLRHYYGTPILFWGSRTPLYFSVVPK